MGLFDGFVETNCCVCHIVIPMPPSKYKALKESGGSFTCINGHSQHFAETEVEKLRRQLEQMTKYRDNALTDRDQYKEWWYESSESNRRMARRIASLRGVITRMKNKAKRDV